MIHVEQINGQESSRPVRQNPVRTAVRFPMRLPLTIQTDSGSFAATTENVSANGILFVCESQPQLNSRIEFTMTMPSSVMGSDKDVLIHCVGRIVRHEEDGTNKKAAVLIDEYYLKA